MDSVRLTHLIKLKHLRVLLDGGQPLLIDFCAQGTRHPLLVVPTASVLHVGGYSGKVQHYGGVGQTYVGVIEFGRGLYPLTLGYLRSGYVREKLGIHNAPDGVNVTIFLNILGRDEDPQIYLNNIPMSGDHVDHEHPKARLL